jgi:hypothetical protein
MNGIQEALNPNSEIDISPMSPSSLLATSYHVEIKLRRSWALAPQNMMISQEKDCYKPVTSEFGPNRESSNNAAWV